MVGTQAIEASLDIDLDVLRTELCPAESLGFGAATMLPGRIGCLG